MERRAVEQLTDRNGRVFFLRKCGKDGASHSGFRWPLTVGAEVEAPDWNRRAECGGGLHGLPWACGDWGLLSGGQWMVFSADPADVVDIDGAKSKVRRARVEHISTEAGCIDFMVAQAPIAIARGRIDPSLLPGDGDGSGYGYGYGDGSGYGYGDGYGDGSGYGYGDGYGYGSGYGYGDGDGYGDGYGYGDLVEAGA